MAINIQPYFNPNSALPTFEQSNPWIDAVNSINAIKSAQLANQATQQINQVRPGLLQNQLLSGQLANTINQDLLPFVTPEAQQQLQSIQLANQASQQTVPYAGRQAAATLAQTQAQTGLTNTEAQKEQFLVKNPQFLITSGIAAQIAALERMQQQNPNDPNIQLMKDYLDSEMKKNAGMGAYYGSNANLKYLPHPVAASMIAHNQQLAQGNNPSVPTTTGGIPTSNPTGNVNNNQLFNSVNGYSPTNGPISNAPNIVNAANSSLIKETVPAPIQAQRYYAQTAGNLYNQASQYLPSVQKYAGLGGKFNEVLQKAASSLGKDNPDYLDLLQFQQSIPLISNDLRRLLGGQATDSERSVMEEASKGNFESETPAQVIQLWKNLGDLLNTASSGLSQSPSDVQSTLGREAKPLNLGTITSNTVRVRSPTGQIGSIPSSRLNFYKSEGFTEVGQ